MQIGSLSEVIVYAKDMNAQVAFYRDKLGLEVTYPAGLNDYAGQYWVTFATGACTLALHGGGEGKSGPDAPKFVFCVTDIHDARTTLEARGVSVGPVREAAPGVLVCDGKDPEGNAFSLESRG
jgi:predicted enzyme related to lactoylglutathione lyase